MAILYTGTGSSTIGMKIEKFDTPLSSIDTAGSKFKSSRTEYVLSIVVEV